MSCVSTIKIHSLQYLAALLLVTPQAVALTGFVAQNQPVSYVAQEKTTSSTLTSGLETLYRPEYQRTDWSGNLYAYPISADANVNIGGERWEETVPRISSTCKTTARAALSRP